MLRIVAEQMMDGHVTRSVYWRDEYGNVSGGPSEMSGVATQLQRVRHSASVDSHYRPTCHADNGSAGHMSEGDK